MRILEAQKVLVAVCGTEDGSGVRIRIGANNCNEIFRQLQRGKKVRLFTEELAMGESLQCRVPASYFGTY